MLISIIIKFEHIYIYIIYIHTNIIVERNIHNTIMKKSKCEKIRQTSIYSRLKKIKVVKLKMIVQL